jgi:hypothetical protein
MTRPPSVCTAIWIDVLWAYPTDIVINRFVVFARAGYRPLTCRKIFESDICLRAVSIIVDSPWSATGYRETPAVNRGCLRSPAAGEL